MSPKYGGTGSGPAIIRNLAEPMGGTAGCSSVPNQGSTFRFTARPRRSFDTLRFSGDATTTDAEATLLRDRSGARILLAEHEPVNREVALSLLEDIGLIGDVADDGEQALDLAQENEYAVILMDMQMPDTSFACGFFRSKVPRHDAGERIHNEPSDLVSVIR